MSLASRVTNFFSSSDSTQGFADADDGLPGGKGSFADGRLGLRSDTMSPEAIEEEARPPYIHVRLFVICFRGTKLMDIVYDCWRSWRHDRRSFDALFGYGQDSAAGRSTYSS